MIENTTKVEGLYVMTGIAIDSCCRMANRLPRCGATIVTGIAPVTYNGRVGVVGIGWQKTCCSMTVTAFSIGCYMEVMLTFGDSAVMAS